MAEGRRFRHPDAGKIVKALFKRIKPVDVRMDILLDIALLLGSSSVVETEGYLCKKNTRVKDGENETAYGMWYKGDAVFAALYSGAELTFPVYKEGGWTLRLRYLAEKARLAPKEL